MNVLRGVRAGEVDGHRQTLAAALVEGGLLIEGSTDTEGHVLCAWVFERAGGALREQALLVFTDFSRGFSPWLFRDWFPRDLRRSVTAGTPMHALLSRWEGRAAASGATEARDRFLAAFGDEVEGTSWERAHGFARLSLPRAAASRP